MARSPSSSMTMTAPTEQTPHTTHATAGMNDAYEHEDASNLEFGKALTGKSPVLFNAEVAVLLDKRRKEYQDKGLRVPE